MARVVCINYLHTEILHAEIWEKSILPYDAKTISGIWRNDDVLQYDANTISGQWHDDDALPIDVRHKQWHSDAYKTQQIYEVRR